LTGCSDGATGEPRGPATPTSHLTDTTPPRTATGPVLRNGRITGVKTRFGKRVSSDPLDYDPATDTALISGLAVLRPEGQTTTLPCPRDFACRYGEGAALGPGPDEVTTVTPRGMARVTGYDGARRQAIDLTATIADGGEIRSIDWSSDGRRLAFVTSSSAGFRVWLVDGAGSAPELAYTVPSSAAVVREGRDVSSYLYGKPLWSSDGQSLLIEQDAGGEYGTDIVILRLLPDGAAPPSTVQTLFHSNRHYDWTQSFAWSPDGTRVAVRTRKRDGSRISHHQITVISAEDGSVIAQRPNVGWVIWLARTGQ
jgi:dipeptidyl aminopeptidase/acylaminoacyl peptidase